MLLFYSLITLNTPSHSDDAIADVGTHPYHEVFVVRDEFTALKFLADKLHDNEVLQAEF